MGVRSLARTVQRQVATDTLHMAGSIPTSPFRCPMSRSIASMHHWKECIRLSAHEIVAGRKAGSAKCTKCLQVCGKKQLRVWLATACVSWQAKDALVIALPPGQPAPDLPMNKFDHEHAETQHEDDEAPERCLASGLRHRG